MPRSQLPAYRLYKARGLAVVTIPTDAGRRAVYLGPYGSPESKAEYARVIAEWQAGRSRTAPATVPAADVTVNEVIVAFWAHAEAYYRRPDGTTTKELSEFRYAFRPLKALYGHTPARSFGPLALAAIRDTLVAAGGCRTRVNKQVGRLKRAFKWAVEKELVPAAVWQGLAAVGGLKRGRSAARESEKVLPAPAADVERAMLHMTPTLQAMVGLQRLSGMRPGEVRELTPAEVDTTGPVWVYRPGSVRPGGHKMAHADRDRTVYLGPKAVEVLRPWLEAAADPSARLFTPRRSKEEWWAMLRERRKSKVTPSQLCRRKPAGTLARKWRDAWTDDTYAAAVAKACVRAGVVPFAPNQVRHMFATDVRARFGLEAAQVLLGHARADVTQVYAERDAGLARKVAAEAG